MKPPTNYLYFGIFSKYGKKIKISPDCPSLFKDTTIEGDQVFLQKIDLYKYESDQLAIKLTAEESTQLEAVEVIRYNFTEYSEIKNILKRKLTDNHFVKFLDNYNQIKKEMELKKKKKDDKRDRKKANNTLGFSKNFRKLIAIDNYNNKNRKNFVIEVVKYSHME